MRALKIAFLKLREHGAGTFAVAALALLLGACHSVPAEKPAGFVQIDIEASPISLDPRFATDAISSRLDELMFESLVKVDRNGRFEGDIAASFERTSPTEIVFHLRHSLHFSDGRSLTARDVKYTYDSVLDPATLSPKRAGFSRLATIQAPDPYTVVMTTKGPYAPALEMGMLGIVPYGAPAGRGSPAPAGSGPFRLTSFVRDEKVMMERNPYNPGPPDAPRGLYFKVVPDPTVRTLELVKGVCDFAENNIDPDLVSYLADHPSLTVIKAPGDEYQYLEFNFRDKRLRDPRVRQAIAYAINRPGIIGHYMLGNARLATGMLAPENWAYDGQVTVYKYDPLKAAHLLEKAGYTTGPGGRHNLTLVYKTTPEGRRLAEVLQGMLKVVGIKVKVRTNEWATFYSDMQRGNFDVASLDWVGIVDPHQYYLVFDSKMIPPNGENRGAYSNPQMDRLLEAGDVTLDTAARKRIYSQVQQLAAGDLPYVSLWWTDNLIVIRKDLVGFEAYPNGSLRSFADLTLAGPVTARGPGE